MKKISILLLSLLTVVSLAACDDGEEKEVSSVDSSEKGEESNSDSDKEDEEDKEDEAKEINKVIADDELVKATLISIEKIDDKDWDEEKYNVNMEIENKSEDTIEVQAHEVSADGKMVDDMVFFSETVSSGKSADATMVIENYDGDLPKMEEDLEFDLVIFSEETFETIKEYDVKIELN